MFSLLRFQQALVPMLLALGMTAVVAVAQAQTAGSSVIHNVTAADGRLEMTVNSSRILTLDERIPRFIVNNPELVKVTPLSANQLQVAAVRPGVTQINLWTESGQIHTVDLLIFGDARDLALLLETEFPHAALKVRPLSNSVVISGYVDRPDHVRRIVNLAKEYYPTVHNNMTVGGVQQVQLHVKVMEVSRTKMRSMGFDFANVNANDFVISTTRSLVSAALETQDGALRQNIAGTTGNVQFGIVNDANAFFGFLELMRQHGVARILSEPTLVTVSGRPAYFRAGGEFGYQVQQPLGTTTVEFKQFGTRVDFVPIVLGNGRIRLEVRPSVSEVDFTLGAGGVPGVKMRELDTGVELNAGQTFALGGLLQHRVEANNRGIPVLADLPWVGAAFRRVEEQINEIELLVLVTPQLVDALDSEQVPPGGPGMFTTSPCDTDFYWRGHIEVPRYSIQAGVYGDQVYDHAAEQVPAVPKSESQTSVSQRPQQREPHGQRAGATEPAAVVAVRAPQAADRTTGTARDAAPLPEPRGTGQTGAPHESSMVTAIDVPGARPQPSRGSVPGLIGPVGFELME